MNKIKKGDEVVVLSGKDKGNTGKVVRLVGTDKVIVQGINQVKKHTKANPNAGITGGIVDKDMPLHISNVGLYDPATKKAGRVGFKFLEDGRKVRYFKSNNEIIDG